MIIRLNISCYGHWNKNAVAKLGLCSLAMSLLTFLAVVPPIQSANASDPRRVLISNLADTSFVVSWLTREAVTGQVRLSDGSLFDDDRGASFSGRTHYVTVAGLQSSATYQFDLVSGDVVYNRHSAHWTVNTGPVLSPFPPNIVRGKVRKPDGSNACDVIVFFAIDRQLTQLGFGVSAPLSALVTWREDGIFQVNLNEARAAGDPTRFYNYGEAEMDLRTLLLIEAMDASGTGVATVDVGDRRLRTSDPAKMLVVDLIDDAATEVDRLSSTRCGLVYPSRRIDLYGNLLLTLRMRPFTAAASVLRL